MSDDELAQRQRRWSRIRTAALVAMVLTVLATIVLIATGGDDEGEPTTVVLAETAFSVDVLRLGDQPVGLVRNGGQVQVFRLVGPDDAAVGYCAAGEVFVSPDAGTVYDIDGVHVAGPGEIGLERFEFEFLGDAVDIDLDTIEEGAPAGFDTDVSATGPTVQRCLAAVDDLEFAPPG
jgi:hypothetical protein